MANADLEVVKVFAQDGKQIGYEVMRADGSIIKVGRDQMVQAVSLGHKYANATISNSGVVRVSSDVPREDISGSSKDKKQASTHKDSNMISHSFNLDLDGGSFNLQVAKDSPEEIPCRVEYKVKQGYVEELLADRHESVVEGLCYISSRRSFLEMFSYAFYECKERPQGYITLNLNYEEDDRPSLWNKIYIIEFYFDYTKIDRRALGRYVMTTFYKVLFEIIKEDNIPYEAYKDCLDGFSDFIADAGTSLIDFRCSRIGGFLFPFELVNAGAYTLGNMVCFDKKTYKDFYKICTEMEKLKK